MRSYAALSTFAILAVALAAGAAGAAEKVTYLLPAPAFLPAFGPWMLAKQRGYFAQEGLDVDFEAAKGGADSAKQVGAGNAVIGGAIGDTPIIVRANGVPVKSVALLGGGGLMQLVLHEDSPIKGPEDLKGKTVTVMAYQDTTYYALLGMLAKVGPHQERHQRPGGRCHQHLEAVRRGPGRRHGLGAGLDRRRDRGRRQGQGHPRR